MRCLAFATVIKQPTRALPTRPLRLACLALVGLISTCVTAVAELPAPYLVRDLTSSTGSAAPQEMVAVAGSVYFTASDGSRSQKLWKTDGSPTGTQPVAPALFTDNHGATYGLTALDGRLVFFAKYIPHTFGEVALAVGSTDGTEAGTQLVTNPELSRFDRCVGAVVCGKRLVFAVVENGYQPAGGLLWSSDGTTEGTQPLGPQRLSLDATRSAPLNCVGDFVYFTVDERTGRRLYRTDGTPQGTIPLLELPRSQNTGRGGDEPTTAGLGTRYFFVATDAAHGRELWSSDGTPAGTGLVADINPGTADAHPAELTAAGNLLFFTAYEPILKDGEPTRGLRRELWQTDGTAAGTQRVDDLALGQSSTEPAGLVADGPVLYFTAIAGEQRGYWKKDTREFGTQRAAVLPERSYPTPPITLAGSLAYVTHNGQLWVSDGTAAGTRSSGELTAGEPLSVHLQASRRAVVGNRLFLTVTQNGSDAALWSTDGTPQGTARLPVGLPNQWMSRPGWPDTGEPFPHAILGDRLVFAGIVPGRGLEPCISDGTVAGTQPLADINRAADTTFNGGQPGYGGELIAAGGIGYFQACTTNGLAEGKMCGWWRTDGTAAGTGTIDLQHRFQTLLGPLAGEMYAVAANQQPASLLRLNADGVTVAADIGNLRSLQPGRAAECDGRLYFAAGDEATGAELCVTDGTTEGTRLIRDIQPGSHTSNPDHLTALGTRLYFTAAETEYDSELWSSDGTAEGTVRVADIWPGPTGSNPQSLTPCGDRLYFIADDGRGLGLWQTDGTAVGTVPVGHLPAAERPHYAGTLTALGDVLYFTRRNAGRWSLWRSDGTAAGTAAVPLAPGLTIAPGLLAVCGGQLCFIGTGGSKSDSTDTGSQTAALWNTDGTPQGTVRLRELPAGADRVPPAVFRVADTLFLSLNEDPPQTDGSRIPLRPFRTLWMSDGSPAGTRRVADLIPNAATASPQPLGAAGDRFYFSADDGTHGRELWAFDLTPRPRSGS